MTFAVHLHDGSAGTVNAHAFDHSHGFVRFYALDEDGHRLDVAVVQATTIAPVTDYGLCPACGQAITDDQPHTWTDGVSDCHSDCCECWHDEGAQP
jgi:hypothetical protein